MTDYRGNLHPSDADLFLYIEDELEARRHTELQKHLSACWECRVRKEGFERGIRNFMEYRRDVLLPSFTPPPPSRRDLHALRSRIHQPPVAMFRMPPPACGWRTMPLASGISMALVIALLATYVLRPPQLTASEFLRNVQQASNRPVPHSKVKAQRIQIRQGNRSIEREIVHSRGGTMVSAAADSQWSVLLANLPVNMEDPLNPAEFVDWHARQRAPQDEIVDGGQTITLISTVPELRASLVVRSSDWRPIAKEFEIPGQLPIEIRETAFTLRNWRPEPPAPASARVTARAGGATTAGPARASVERRMGAAVDLDLVELQVREMLRETAADRREVPAIERRNGRVHVTAVAESAARRKELTAALGELSDVELHVPERSDDGGLQATTGVDKPRRVVPPAFATDPPLARALWEYMGSMDLANQHLDSVHSQWLRAMSASRALGRLAERYPEQPKDEAGPGAYSTVVRERLLHLAGRYREEVGELTRAYLHLLDEPLEEMLRLRRNRTVDDRSTALPPAEGCPSWQVLALEVMETLESLQLSVRRLFLIDYAETPLTLSADTLLRDAGHARARLDQQLGCLAQP